MIKVGLIGTGGMGRVHARQYRKFPDVELYAFDIDHNRAEAFAKDTGALLSSSLESLVSAVDVADICLPTHLHLETAKYTLAEKKPTFCEKPLCRTAADCEILMEVSERNNVPLMPAQVVRYFPEFRKATEMVRAGAVGKPAAIRTRRGGAAPTGAGGWFMKFEYSGGVLLDLAIHDFDWIRWTFGEVRRVFSQSLTFSGVEGLDYSLTTLTLASGAIAHVEGTWADPAGFRVSFEVAGSDGFIEHDSRCTSSLRATGAGIAAAESPLQPADDPYYREISDFLEAVRTGSEPPVTAFDGMKAVQICEAAIESARTGRAVEIY